MTDATQTDAQELARTELAQAMVPAPGDLLDDVGPLALVWYLRELSYTVLTTYTAMLSDPDVSADIGDDDEPVRALAALGEAVGSLDGACILLRLLDDAFGT